MDCQEEKVQQERYRSGQSRPLGSGWQGGRWCSGVRTRVLLPLSLSFCWMGQWEENRQQAGLAIVLLPFGEQRSMLINEKKIVVSVSFIYIPEPPSQRMFGSQTRIPVANVEKPCKYFDLDLCFSLNGLSRGFYCMDSEWSTPALEWWGIKLRLLILFVKASPCMFTLHLRSGKVRPNLLAWFSVFCVGSLRGYV